MPDDVNDDAIPGGDSDLEGLTDDQLDALLDKTEEGDHEGSINLDQDLAVEEDEDPEDDKKDEEEDKDPDTDEDTEDADDADDSKDSEEDEDKEEDTDEDEEDDGLSPAARAKIESVLERVETLEAEKDKLTADLTRERLLRDRNAGKLGALMQKLERTQDGDASGDDDLADEDSESRSKAKTSGDKALEEIRHEKVERSINSAAADFYTQNQEFFKTLEAEVGEDASEKFQADLVSRIRENQKAMGEDIYGMAPKTASRIAGTLIDSAFADLKLSLTRDLRKQAAEQEENSRRKVRARKKGAAGARSKKSGGPVSKTRTKSLSQMSDAELDKALEGASFE